MVIRLPKWLILCVSALLLSQGNKVVDNLFEYSKNIEIFTALYKELGTTYVDEVEPGKLMKTGIDAMLKSLDPYTNFFSEYQAEEALMERQGQYGGVGCKITIRNHFPTVDLIEEGDPDKLDASGKPLTSAIGQVIGKQPSATLRNRLYIQATK
jgi:carboxyl-terminal processing protease